VTVTSESERSSAATADGTRTVDAVVVGAGFSGLYTLHRFRELGFTVQVYEAAADVGGTWYWNRYPGCRCDVESMEYSYSFDKELEQEWDWTERYATQPEILGYVNHVADRYDLRPHIQFETRVTGAVYDEAAQRWTITTDRGEEVSAQFFVLAVGCLSASKKPEIPGLERYEGSWYHTGHWPHEGVDFTGQRVAVIGTGSSGIQSIPLIAEQAAQLTVFQRTPNFTMPAQNAPLDPDYVRERKADYPAHRQAARESGFGIPVPLPEQSALEADPEERWETYRQGFERGNLVGMMLAYNDLLTNKEANDTAAEYVRHRIRETVADPEVAEALCPTDHPIATKRPCLDTNYYATYNRPNVSLVNLRTTPLVEITEKGLRTSEQDYEFDSIVFATGFDAMTGALLAFDIAGRDGTLLRDKWAAGPRSYLGIGAAGFPNMFIITGPGSPSVLSNMMVSIEQHVEWISDCASYVREHGKQAIEATAESEEYWVDHVNEVGNTTLYPTANSWYMGSNVPGKPRVFMPYIGGVGAYRQICDDVAAKGYEGFTLT
jgi:cyclohexanone monooxygenase